ncbi:MAG: hypothetical protein ABI286_13135 [Edaphobacter sp.]
MYYCLNASAHLPGEAGGVLIRANPPPRSVEPCANLVTASRCDRRRGRRPGP